MCGIACVLNTDSSQPVDPLLLRQMSDRLAHRGPDGEGHHVDGPLGLASRRLAIIDLETGQQPVANEDGTVWVVFNGEIYNYRQLRETLTARGHQLRTQSDTETLVHLYEEHGTDLVHQLRGMFAFALWDARRRRLILARDRLGVKPLYYATPSGMFACASEIKALLPLPGLDTSIDPESIDRYLTCHAVPAPHTVYQGVHKLLPAHLLIVEDGRMEMRCYWRVPSREPLRVDERECSEEVLRLLREATSLRMVSDVPLGAFLSGGIDSSLVVALMQKESATRVRTFSVGFNEKDPDLEHARAVARHVGTEHHEFVVRPDAVALLPRLVRAYDEPFADPSSLPSFHVAHESRREVTVALNGDGGDEAFAGYMRYPPQQMARYADRLPMPLRRALTFLPSLGPPFARWLPGARRAAGLLRGAALSPLERYARSLTMFDGESRQRLYTPEFARRVAASDPLSSLRRTFERSSDGEFLDRLLAIDLENYLPDVLLPKMDIASMANSLEARSPFLDHVLVEFAARVPAHLKIRRFTTKYILRRAGEGLLPSQVLERGKQGFAPPLDQWFRDALGSYASETLLSQRALGRGYFTPEGTRALLEEHGCGRVNNGPRIWALLMLETWHRIFVDGEAL